MLDLEKLEKVRHAGGKVTARCPACHENGADRSGQHLVFWPDTGKFACSANAGDALHRRRIWALCGIPKERSADYRPDPGDIRRRREEALESRRLEALRTAARNQADRIFRTDWPLADILEESPLRLDGEAPDWRLMLEALFLPDDVIWTGEPRHSGPGFEDRFRAREAWLEHEGDAPPFPMICADTFAAGSVSRSQASVAESRYIVVEADDALGRKPVNAEERVENIRRNLCIARWLARDLHWRLRAIVHTGGKSCHCWFDRPGEDHIRELKAVASALGIDASVFTAAHPVRQAGVRHEKTGRTSRLLYLG